MDQNLVFVKNSLNVDSTPYTAELRRQSKVPVPPRWEKNPLICEPIKSLDLESFGSVTFRTLTQQPSSRRCWLDIVKSFLWISDDFAASLFLALALKVFSNEHEVVVDCGSCDLRPLRGRGKKGEILCRAVACDPQRLCYYLL